MLASSWHGAYNASGPVESPFGDWATLSEPTTGPFLFSRGFGMIRPATVADTSTIAALIRALGEYERLSHEVVFDEDRLRDHLFGPRPFAEVLLAEDANEIAGYALFFPCYSTFRGQPGIFLEDLFVRPEHRGKGHGKALLAEVARLASERGCGSLEWIVLNWNEPALRFYRALGAVPKDEWTQYCLCDDALHTLARAA
jgi:GNAT superfamily N-acetyltransferase